MGSFIAANSGTETVTLTLTSCRRTLTSRAVQLHGRQQHQTERQLLGELGGYSSSPTNARGRL